MNKIVNLSLLGSDNTLVVANYTAISENIRRLTPHGIQCSIFCGGSNCKYENPESWTADSLALQGIYSHWITDNILAMARPSTAVIIKKNIIQQFQSLGIKSIINLQCAKEHASCGEPLEESGFSYEPNVFMENDIYYYNFAWKDYGDATLSSLLSMIKVLAFATKEGRVAVHCHAGLGRTGVLIACYLVYSLRVTANDAIKYVRLRRPGSVQTRGQILCVRQFAQFILPKNITYFFKDSKDKYMTEFTLQRFLSRQKVVLHGYDERNFKFVPKIVHIICERILQLCGCRTDEFELSNMSITTDFLCSTLHGNVSRNESIYSISSICSEKTSSNSDLTNYDNSLSPVSPNQSENDEQASLSQLSNSFSDLNNLEEEEDIQQEFKEKMLQENKCFQELQTQKTYEKTSIPENIYSVGEVICALLADGKTNDEDIKQSILRYKNEINTSQLGWLQLQSETNLFVLTILLFEWLECLKIPVLNKEKLEKIVINYQQPENCFKKLGLEEGYLIEYLLNFLTKLNPISLEDQNHLLVRITAALAQQTVTLNEKQIPTGKTYRRLGEGTLNCTTKFLQQLMELIRRRHFKSTAISENQSISSTST